MNTTYTRAELRRAQEGERAAAPWAEWRRERVRAWHNLDTETRRIWRDQGLRPSPAHMPDGYGLGGKGKMD